MAPQRVKRAPYVVLAVLLFVVVSQVVDLAAGATEVGVRVTVMVVAAVGAVVTAGWLLRHRRSAPAPGTRLNVTRDAPAEDPDAA